MKKQEKINILVRSILWVVKTGIVDSSISIGALIGSLLMLTGLFSNKIKMAIFGLSIEGIALIIAGLFVDYSALIIFALILGFGVCLASVGISTLYQTMIPKNKMGRVMSLVSALSSCTVPLGTLFGSLIISQIEMSSTLIISGIIVTLSGISLLVPFKDEYKKIKMDREVEDLTL